MCHDGQPIEPIHPIQFAQLDLAQWTVLHDQPKTRSISLRLRLLFGGSEIMLRIDWNFALFVRRPATQHPPPKPQDGTQGRIGPKETVG
jgi:hypothetical protein